MKKTLLAIWLLIGSLFGLAGAFASERTSPAYSGTFDWQAVQVLDLDTSQRIALAENTSIAAAFSCAMISTATRSGATSLQA